MSSRLNQGKAEEVSETHSKRQRHYSLYNIWIVTTALKLLLFYAYHSTDFDVHRNWLAITNGTPLKEWYIESTSQWTLDYPPFFAYFEYSLSLLVPSIVKNDGCLDIVQVGVYSWPTIYYQRLSVIVSEILFFVSLQWYIDSTSLPVDGSLESVLPGAEIDSGELSTESVAKVSGTDVSKSSFSELHVKDTSLLSSSSIKNYDPSIILSPSSSINKKRAYVIASSLVLSPGLLIVDHIHFQYNGMMYGILIFALNSARLKKYNQCGLYFSILLCFKHIYLYFAPAVFIFLLRAHCLNFERAPNFKNLLTVGFWKKLFYIVQWRNLFSLSSIVLSVFAIAFGPFVYYGVIPQLFSRLFPFSRGLTHAYWAPNIWAIYSFFDRVLIQVYKRVPYAKSALEAICKVDLSTLAEKNIVNSSTRGLVGEVEFLILPNITPKLTFLLTSFYQILALIPLFLQPNFKRFIGSLTLCGFASYLFGWHVHEKAILLVIFPMTFLVTLDKGFLGPFNMLVSSGYVSLFPLIFTCDEWLIKVVYTLLWYIIFYFNFRKVVEIPKKNKTRDIILDRVIHGYILGLPILVSIITLMDLLQYRFEVLQKMEFLKLMFTSIYCAVGIISSWNGFTWVYFVNDGVWDDSIPKIKRL